MMCTMHGQAHPGNRSRPPELRAHVALQLLPSKPPVAWCAPCRSPRSSPTGHRSALATSALVSPPISAARRSAPACHRPRRPAMASVPCDVMQPCGEVPRMRSVHSAHARSTCMRRIGGLVQYACVALPAHTVLIAVGPDRGAATECTPHIRCHACQCRETGCCMHAQSGQLIGRCQNLKPAARKLACCAFGSGLPG